MKKLCIDPGHGLGNVRGNVYDPGAISAGVSEADIVLQYALAIRWLAKERGHDVFLTRDDANDITPVGNRNELAQGAGCQVFISLHCNSGVVAANGTETYFRDADDKALAQKINTAVVNALQFRDRGVKSERESQHSRLAVLDFRGPACLLELGFISNQANREKLLLRSSRLAVGNAILDVVERM